MKKESMVAAVFGAIIRVLAAILIIYVIYNAALACYDYGYRIFTEPAVSQGTGREVTVTITAEMSPSDIGKLFESKGLVRDWRLFAMQYLLSENREDVAPGTFVLSTSMTAEEMMAAMVPEQREVRE